MIENIPVLSFILLAPLVGMIVVLLLPKQRSTWLRTAALVFTLIPLVLALWLFASYRPSVGGEAFAERYTWLSVPLNANAIGGDASITLAFDYHLGIDGLSLPLVLLTAIVSAMAVLASVHIRKRWKTYFTLLLLLQTGMYGVFLARDLIEFFIFFELTLIPTFFLIGIWGYYGREKAATRFLVYNGLGSAAMLLAFLMLVATAGFSVAETTNAVHLTYSGSYDDIIRNLSDPGAYANIAQAASLGVFLSDNLKWASFILLLVAFGIKIPIFPFHTWMLRVHTEAPPAIVMIHSGILLKMGVYGLIRFGGELLPAQLESWSTILAILGVINILYGAVLACVQTEFKLVLAYSSISHMGIVLLGIASMNEIGLQGAIFQSVSHGLISALLFLIVGSIYERTGSTELGDLGGLAKAAPFMSGILLVAGMASLGLPGLSGFVGEFMAFLGLFGTQKWLTAIGVLGILLAAVYVLRSVLAITFGALPDRLTGLKDARLIEAIPMIILTTFIVLLGIYPSVLTDVMQQSFGGLLEQIQPRTGG